ncbi:response regulator transcription factor [Novipirellula artificiosorum]|uniref:Alkaline phosphatase synthesis transcriptional regulatory protein PhoP n=1 Tax=Novipirellula artificiosorum TaxID=2528016 RepID=A0A5C6E385_9BACT|nr:response regulator transcription factor [Novipirellula artificiosorum]TWU42427.1 Alkaline phosphatase synthesis transcriptional regulatory protein PhoP [Novipirellula artificiosorum]
MTTSKVLIIEDDATLLRGLSDNLRCQGYDVCTATEGKQGLEAALSLNPDLILLDIMLPGINGYQICDELRRRKLTCTIIMLTAKGQEEDIVRGLELGADDYVTKPFSIRELLARVKAFLRRQNAEAISEYHFGDLHLDLLSHKLSRRGQEVKLTAKEYRLLEFFVQRRSRALTRNEILNHVWGRSVIVTGRSVDRCVTTLRQKIEDDVRNPTFIRTIRDVGYRFEKPQDATNHP